MIFHVIMSYVGLVIYYNLYCAINTVSTLSNHGGGDGPILPIQCSGDEDHLSDCNIALSSNTELCTQVAGIICEGT